MVLSELVSACAPILVLDDDPHVRKVLCALLKEAGFDVVSAADTRAALAECELQMPQLMIVDLMLPIEDGESFLDQFRLRWRSQDIPVIVLSASAKRDAIAHRLNARAAVAKPFAAEELCDLVLKHVPETPFQLRA